MIEQIFHIAQINIAAMRFPLDHAEMAPFVAQLDSVNALADGAPGFVWRLQDKSGDATAIKAYAKENILINVSVWTGIEALFEFSYRTAHLATAWRGSSISAKTARARRRSRSNNALCHPTSNRWPRISAT